MPIRYTTPTLTLIARGIDLTGMDAVTVSLRQRIGRAESTHAVDVEDPTMTYDGADTTIPITLTQEQSGGFVDGKPVEVQVNWLDGTGRDATTIGTVMWQRNLLNEVMEADA